MRSWDLLGGAVRIDAGGARVGRALIDLAWPSSCAGCDSWGAAWCAACQRATAISPVCVRPVLAPALRVYAAVEYSGPLARAITAFKDRGRCDLAPVLAGFLRVALAEAIVDGVVADGMPARYGAPLLVVPVPSSPAATRARGRFAWGEVVREAVVSTGWLESRDVLVSNRSTRDQSRLSRTERARNMAGAVTVCERRSRHGDVVRGRHVIVVDDVVTTGASLGAAVLALAALRPLSISCATIAAAP